MIEITKKKNELGNPMYQFDSIDEDGIRWDLGHAAIRIQDEGTEEELFWFEGTFDTRAISFCDDAELINWLKKWRSKDEVYFTEA